MSDNVNILQPSSQPGPVHLLDVFSMLMDDEEDGGDDDEDGGHDSRRDDYGHDDDDDDDNRQLSIFGPETISASSIHILI